MAEFGSVALGEAPCFWFLVKQGRRHLPLLDRKKKNEAYKMRAPLPLFFFFRSLLQYEKE